jgi:uncharacterized protein
MTPLPLPRGAHVPGTGTEPDRAPLEAAKALVPRPVTAADWEENEPYRYGAALCLNGFFWEAHEVWEAVWLACPPNGGERRLLRALIQLANAALKLTMERPSAACRLFVEAEELLADLGGAGRDGSLMGVDLAAQRRAAVDALRAVEANEPAPPHALFVPLRVVTKGWTSGSGCTIMHINGARTAL